VAPLRRLVAARLGSRQVSRVVYGSTIGLELVALEAHPPPPAAVIASLLGTAVAVAAVEFDISFPAVFFLLAASVVQAAVVALIGAALILLESIVH
jgi:hypothetical protein